MPDEAVAFLHTPLADGQHRRGVRQDFGFDDQPKLGHLQVDAVVDYNVPVGSGENEARAELLDVPNVHGREVGLPYEVVAAASVYHPAFWSSFDLFSGCHRKGLATARYVFIERPDLARAHSCPAKRLSFILRVAVDGLEVFVPDCPRRIGHLRREPRDDHIHLKEACLGLVKERQLPELLGIFQRCFRDSVDGGSTRWHSDAHNAGSNGGRIMAVMTLFAKRAGSSGVEFTRDFCFFFRCPCAR